MRYREINQQRADAVLKILIEECGYRLQSHDGLTFTIIAPRPDGRPVCAEYRFIGALGFGGKFRNNGNNGNIPYVDCYREHETPERLNMMRRANVRLAALFAETKGQPT